MPVSKIQVPDGRILEIEHPVGASEKDLFAFASMQSLVSPPPYTPDIPAMTELDEEEPGFFEDVKEFGQRTLGSAASILAQAPAGIQSMFREGIEEDEELVERNRKIQESISSSLGYDEEYDDSMLGLSSNVLGSILGFGGASLGAGVAGSAIGTAIFPGAGTLIGGVLGTATGALLGAGSNVASGMEETARQIERGQIVTDEDYEAATTKLAGIGATEGLPFMRPVMSVLRRISGAAKKNPKAVEKLTDYIRSAAIQGTEEAAQEALAGIASDAVLKEYINPDIEIGESLGVDLVAGGLGGALFDVGINLATRNRRSGGADDEVKPLRDELVAEEEALRAAIEQNESARQERISQRFATTPEIEIDQVDTVLPEAVEVAGLIPVSETTTSDGRVVETIGDAPADPEAYRSIARRTVQQLGDQFPTEPVFEVKEISPGFSAVVDDKGKIYGTTAQGVPTELASRLSPLSVALNSQTIEEKIYQNNRRIIAESKENYTPDQIKTLQRLGRIALGSESLSYSAEAANYAGGTTENKGFLPQLSPENVIENNIPRKKQTIAQRINVKRIKNGQLPTNRFALSEIRREIGADVGRLAEYEAGAFAVDTYRALPMPVDGKFAVVAEALGPDGKMERTGEVIYDRPPTLTERQAAREEGRRSPRRVKFLSARDAAAFAQAANLRKGQADIPSQDIMGDPEFGIEKIKELLREKNISSGVNSKEIKSLAARFTGKKLRRDQGLSNLSPAERQLFYQKIRQLPRFDSPTKIPEFKLLRPKEVDAVVEESVQQEPVAALPSPSTPSGMDSATKGVLERAINSRLKRLGLSDISGVVTDLVRGSAKDADGNVILGPVIKDADLTVEGGYSSGGASRVLQVALDAIMSRAKKPEDVEAAVIDVLNHEVIHALRNLDVITQAELQLLERLAGKYRKVDGGQTYVDWARSTYREGNPVMVMEEAIAEMMRDAMSGRVLVDNKPAKVSGKPRAIFNKIVKFFKGMFGVAKDVDQDYKSFTQFLNDLESGRIGERERGQVRTLYRLEQAAGEFVDRPAPIGDSAKAPPSQRESEQPPTQVRAKVSDSDELIEEAGLGQLMFSRRSDMPPPENAQRTQIVGTLPTYRKARDILDREASGDRSLDFGAGLGIGAQELGYDSYEPFPKEGFSPTYTSPDQIEPRSYDKIVNLNVLNVVPRDARDRIVKDIGTALDAGGVAIITTRGKDVLNAKGKKGPEPTSIITTRGTYQKGFSKKELVDYLKDTLGPSFEVSPLNLGPAGAIVRRTDFDRSSFSKRDDTKHGVLREYITSSRGKVSGQPALPKAINPGNGKKQLASLKGLADRHPDPLESKAAWLRFERDLLGDNETPVAPTGIIRLYNDIDGWVEKHEQLSPQQVSAAGEGFSLVKEMSDAYASGDATVDTTGKLMLWGMLSRMLSAHPHESAFLDAAIDEKLSEFIKRAVDREWTQSDIDEYLQWTETVIPDFAPSKQGTSNLRDFGKTFLPKMSKRMPQDSDPDDQSDDQGDSGKSGLQELHDLIADKSIPSSEVRAKYYGINKGMGIQNKVLSFVMLMTGREDVVVLDRIQINSMWDSGRFGKLIYDDVASLFEGAHGLARYEALERSLSKRVGELYDRIGRPNDASVGRYHWESWVRDSGQVVSHPTIKGLISEATTDQELIESYADIGAPEGRYHQFAFGSVYARDPNGNPYILYRDSKGVPFKFGLKRFKEFLGEVKKPSNGVIPSGFSVKSYREAGYPWYESSEVNRERLDQIIRDFAEGETSSEKIVSDAIEAESEADVTGQGLADDVADGDRISFSRRKADRDVERSSQKAVDDVLSYAEKTEPDAIGVETLRYGPLAYSINAGYSNQNGAAPTFTSPSRSWFNKLVFEVQDKLTDLRAIEDAINESRKARGLDPIPVSESAYIGEETIPGKIAAFNSAFERNELEPLIKLMSEKDVSIEQMDEFLVLRHAIERNERIRKINPSMPDAGSGKWDGQELTDNYVKSKMLADFGMDWDAKSGTWKGGNARAKILSDLASRLDKINRTTLAINEKGGLITEQDREFLEGFYKYYTPLRGISQDEDIAADTSERTAGSGGSLSTIGKETKRAMGRATEAVSPMATIVSDRGTQVARAIKNTSFGQRLVELIKKNPNDDVWQLISPDDPKYKRAFDSTYTYVGPDASRYGERKRDISDESDKKNWVKRVKVVQDPVLNPYAEELLGVKVDGQQYYVLFNNPDLRKAAINLDAQSTSRLVNGLSSMTRWMSYVNTSLNPEFVVGNFARDVQTAIANIIGEQTMEGGKALGTKKMVRNVMKRTLPSIKVFYKGITNPQKLSGQDAIDFNEFIKTGSKTDWFHSLPPEQQKKNIAMMVEMANGTFKGGAAKGFSAVKSFVDDTNNAVENGVRLATFVAARDSFIDAGISRDLAIQQAATLAKNLTVNFNRRGNSGQLLNSLYLFFNASVQGTVNTMRGLNVLDPNSSRTKQGMVAAIMGFGALMAAIGDMALEEDEFEDIEDYVRDRNMVIPHALWGGDPKLYSTIPLPYGYNVFYNMGENAYLVAAGKESPEDAAVRATNVFLGSFSPLGTSSSETFLGSAAKTATPQVLKPITELVMNENYFGSPIYPPESPYGVDAPASRRSFSNTAQVWKNITETLGSITGGNESEPGLLEVPPDALSYLLNYGLGGAGSFLERTFFKVPPAVIDESVDLEIRDIPFVRRVLGEINTRADSEKFYERRETLQRKDRQANDILRGKERNDYLRKNSDYMKMVPILSGTDKSLRTLRKQLRQIKELKNVSPDRAIELANKEKFIQERIDKLIQRFNDRYDIVVGKTK